MDLIHMIALCFITRDEIGNNNFAIVSPHIRVESSKEGDSFILSPRRWDFFLLQKIDDNNIDNDDEFFSLLIPLFNFLYWMYAAFH